MEYKRLTNQEWSENIDLTQELGYSYIYKRLHELEDKIEQGTLIELPCKVGDTVYEIQEIRNRVQAYKVTKIITDGKYFHFEWRVNEPCGVYGKINGFEDYELGRYVFLSKEAAEKALKGCVG